MWTHYKRAKTKSQVCDKWKVAESCHKFLDKLLTYSVTREQHTRGQDWGPAILVFSSGCSDSLAVKDKAPVLPLAMTRLYLQVLSAVCKLLLLW